MTEPLRLNIDIACRPDHAFATWTEAFARWWPRQHTVTGDPADIVLEPRLGGRIYERTYDGRELDWGEITVWEPPTRIAYLWHIRRDRADATDVEIRFVAADEDSTRMEIIHTGWGTPRRPGRDLAGRKPRRVGRVAAPFRRRVHDTSPSRKERSHGRHRYRQRYRRRTLGPADATRNIGVPDAP